MMRLFLFAAAVTAASAAAQTVALPPEPEARFDLTDTPQAPPPLPEAEAAPAAAIPEMSSAELLQQPALLRRALDSAILLRDTQAIRLLLPLYRQLPDPEPILLGYAQARLHTADGRLHEAERIYRRLLAEHPHLAPVRLDLVQVLLHNRRNREAAAEIETLRQQPDLPAAVNTLLNRFDLALAQQQKWQFAANVQYEQDDNINQAPQQSVLHTPTGTWRFPERQSAHGLAYGFSAAKTTPLAGHWAWHASAQVSGRFFWDNHDYDDLIVRSQTGPTYRTARQEWQLLPFYERRWFGTRPYSQHYGAQIRYNRVLNPKWTLRTAVQYGHKEHDTRTFLDGGSLLTSATVSYRSSPQQNWLLGMDYSRESARDPSAAYRRIGLRAGWQRITASGWEGTLQLGTAQRRYRAPDWFLDVPRRDREYWGYASVGNRKWQWKGLMPKLAWSSSYQSSNHMLHRNRKNRIFIEVGKQF
ncbi:hypothetical protein L1281_001401 [Neisseria sp. HSC-16F19]|nr:surface lipoprotein assembly modifier [Neisseria sp. HSC-16F19]MCP2040811.1 hypothetical protein [Neisseria sp. HSC-16F19]